VNVTHAAAGLGCKQPATQTAGCLREHSPHHPRSSAPEASRIAQ
jgi:hypothetical protein